MKVKKLETKDAPVTWTQLGLIAHILFNTFLYVAVSSIFSHLGAEENEFPTHNRNLSDSEESPKSVTRKESA